MNSWRKLSLTGVSTIALALSACGGGAGAGEGDGGELEKTQLTVGTIPIADYAALDWAAENGFFEEEGLDVTIKTIQGGPVGVQQTVSGELDFTNSPVFVAVMAADSGLPIRTVVLTSALGENSMGVFVPKNSPIKSLEDLDGKSIGTNTTQNIGDITFNALVESEGVEVSPDWVEVPFPEMISGVKAKSIDAGYMPEPFATQADDEGMRMVADLSTGPNDDLAAASFLSSERFVKENPNTTAAFARAMYAAGEDMAEREGDVREWLPEHSKIDTETAQKMALPSYYGEFNQEDYGQAVSILKDQELVTADLQPEDTYWQE